MKNDEITLQEFLDHLRYCVNKFEEDWKKNAKNDPEDWPMQLGVPEWWEQFDYMAGHYEMIRAKNG